MAQSLKNLPAMQETWVRKIPWRRAWPPTPVFLPGESPWIEEPGRLQCLGWQRDKHDWATQHAQKDSYIFILLESVLRLLNLVYITLYNVSEQCVTQCITIWRRRISSVHELCVLVLIVLGSADLEASKSIVQQNNTKVSSLFPLRERFKKSW